MVAITPLQFGVPGGPELLIVLVVLILLFGAQKIPKLARSTGQAMGEFQRGRQEIEEELEEIKDGPGSDDAGASAEGSGTADEDSATAADESEPERNA